MVRAALRAYCVDNTRDVDSERDGYINDLRGQISVKDRQFEQVQTDLSEQSKRHDTIILQMQQSLDRTQMQLEDKGRSWWQRFRKR
jgi:N-glycosylase/DNA lyase